MSTLLRKEIPAFETDDCPVLTSSQMSTCFALSAPWTAPWWPLHNYHSHSYQQVIITQMSSSAHHAAPPEGGTRAWSTGAVPPVSVARSSGHQPKCMCTQLHHMDTRIYALGHKPQFILTVSAARETAQLHLPACHHRQVTTSLITISSSAKWG